MNGIISLSIITQDINFKRLAAAILSMRSGTGACGTILCNFSTTFQLYRALICRLNGIGQKKKKKGIVSIFLTLLQEQFSLFTFELCFQSFFAE